MGMVGKDGDEVFLSLALYKIIFCVHDHALFHLSGAGDHQVLFPFNLDHAEAAAFSWFLEHSILDPFLALVDRLCCSASLGHR